MSTRPVPEQVRGELAGRPHVTVDFASGQPRRFALECIAEGFEFTREQALEKQPVKIRIGHTGIIIVGVGLTTPLCRVWTLRRTEDFRGE